MNDNKRFIKIPNIIFSYQLTPKSIMVYAYINSRMNSLHAAVLSYEDIAKGCRMDRKTAGQAVKELVRNQLIEKKVRCNYRGKLKNQYIISGLSGGWFKVEYQVLKDTSIRCTDFTVYCYVRMCMDKKNESFPSLKAISYGTHISHGRVAVAIQYLRHYTFINRVRRHYRRTRAYRHNRFLLFRFQPNSKKMKARSQKQVFRELIKCCTANYSSSDAIVVRSRKNVKLFFACRGSPQFPHLLFRPTKLQLRKNSSIL